MKASRLDRALRPFTEVRPGEGFTALLMFVNVFLVLCAYYFIKPVREGWLSVSDVSGISQMELKAYSSFGQTVLLVPVVWGYGHLSSRMSRGRLITIANLFCMSNLLVFWALQPDFFMVALPATGILFYLWVGMFGVFVVAQFWTFAADIYSNERGKRLLPLIAIGATAGAASGSWITQRLLDWGVFGTEWLLMAAMFPMAASIALTLIIDRRESALAESDPVGAGSEDANQPPEAAPQGSGRSALAVVFGSRLLLSLAAITMLLNWVNTTGETLLYTVVQETLASDAASEGISDAAALLQFTKDGTTAFYANFFTWVNVVALLLQAFVASRLLKYGGFGVLIMMLPVVALMSYSTMALIPVLAIVKFMKVAENSTDYSINNTARSVAWLPVSAEETYKGKPAIDTLFARIGDGFAALTVLVGVNWLVLPTQSFFVINVALVVIWLAASFIVIREYNLLSPEVDEREDVIA